MFTFTPGQLEDEPMPSTLAPIDVTMNLTGPVDADLFAMLTGAEPGELPEPQPRAIEVQGRSPIRLLTGGRGRRTRAQHARVLRVARLRRRVARRERRPVAWQDFLITMHAHVEMAEDGSLLLTGIQDGPRTV